MKTIYFDMDGTIADLYAVDNWLEYLLQSNPFPYQTARTMFNFSAFAKLLHKAQSAGYQIGIISWLSKNSTKEYDEQVRQAKLKWLGKHLPSVSFDKIYIIPYGTPKYLYATNQDILFDDEINNRTEWPGKAYNVLNLLETLKTLI